MIEGPITMPRPLDPSYTRGFGDGFLLGLAQEKPYGCICPAELKNGCSGLSCPRKNHIVGLGII